MITNDAAKKLFWNYGCNHFGLHHDDKLEEYKRLGGGCPEKEAEWTQEYIAYWLARISTTDLTAVNRLRWVRAHEAIKPLLEITDYGDDYSKFWFADCLASLSRCPRTDKKDEADAMLRARQLWEEVVFHPVGVSPQHKKKVTQLMLASLDATSAEEYVENYARRKLYLPPKRNRLK